MTEINEENSPKAAETVEQPRRTRTRRPVNAEGVKEMPETIVEPTAEKKPAAKTTTRKPAAKATTTKPAAKATTRKPAAKATTTKPKPAAKTTTEAAKSAPAEGASDTGAARPVAKTVVTERKPRTRRSLTQSTDNETPASVETKHERQPESNDHEEGREPSGETNGRRSESTNHDQSHGNGQNHNDQNQQNQNKNGGKQSNQNNGRNGNGRRQKRRGGNNNNEPVEPKTNIEELAAMKVAELRAKAAELELDISEIKKKEELVSAVYEAALKAEGFEEVSGILDVLPEGYGFIRTAGYLPGEHDAYVGTNAIRKNRLRRGDFISGQIRPPRDNEKYSAIHRIDTVNGIPLAELGERVKFAELTPIYPDERLTMEHGKNFITARTIDLVAPIGKGQRGLIVSPPKAGKTTILKDIAASISANNPEVHLMCLLVDERPEEVTDMERSVHGEVISSTFDMPCENHTAVAELVIERAKRLVEMGADVVILLDSITRLARAYNLAQPASGRILSGGIDSTALYPPKRFLGAARNIEFGGSLTILASALVDTGSKMDEVIFEEFKGTGNLELKLDRSLADRRIFPAIDPVSSGTRKEELLLDPQEAPFIWGVRRILANMNNTERAMEMLIKGLKQTENNQEFLIRTAKKAQEKNGMSIEV